MNSRQFLLDDQVKVVVSKRSSSRNIRLTIGNDGIVKVSIPRWVPYKEAVRFAYSKLDWIKSKTPRQNLRYDTQRIGKNHQLIFRLTNKSTITTRLNDLEAIVFYPNTKDIKDPDIQLAAKRIVKKALMSQAKQLLPIRLKQLADKYDYGYSSVVIKSLKSRWGSCDSHKNITLNLYLMELPWELIDYVLLHELNHTKVMQHGPKFWDSLEERLPNYKELRKQLKTYSTVV